MSFIPFTMGLVAAFVTFVPLAMVALVLSGAAVAPARVRKK